MVTWYKSLMNSDKNPLSALPPVQRFQTMVLLSVMWSVIFCVAIGSWLWFGELVLGHVAVVTGIFVTSLVFHQSRRETGLYRDHPSRDGTARYDDVWGG